MLGTPALLLMGLGVIIGVGIFILTGVASANYSGPALVVSFAIAGTACLFTTLCYAEFASLVPVADSAYTYSYVTLGGLLAWIIGWDLMLEYLVIVAVIAVGWSGYIVSLLTTLGLNLPAQFINPPGVEGGLINLPAVIIIGFLSLLLIKGSKESSRFNTVIVMIKLAIILIFISIGVNYINPANYHPFLSYGWTGVFQGAAIISFVMSLDGLLPPLSFQSFIKTSKPSINSIIIGGVVAMVIALFFPITDIAELVNTGTLAAFIIVSASVIVLRRQRPDLERTFKNPIGTPGTYPVHNLLPVPGGGVSHHHPPEIRGLAGHWIGYLLLLWEEEAISMWRVYHQKLLKMIELL